MPLLNYPAPPVVPNDAPMLTDQGMGDNLLAVTGTSSSLGLQVAAAVLLIGVGALAVGIARLRKSD